MTYLLDVNVLLALVDPLHVHSRSVHTWFAAQPARQWATCPITENGFVRIISQASYTNPVADTAAAMGVLRGVLSRAGHEFWPDGISLPDCVQPGIVITPTQITDVYLLGLAAHRGGKMATFDRRVPVHAVPGGSQSIEFIPV